MEVRVHRDVPEFWEVARPLFAGDPMRHTHGLTAIRRLVAAPDPTDETPTLLSLWSGGRIAGAAYRVPPWPLGVSAVPHEATETVAAALLELEPDLPSAGGPRDTAEHFGEVWATLTGSTAREIMAMRLYRLERLFAPAVPGRARLATVDDLPLLAERHHALHLEAAGAVREPDRVESHLRRMLALGDGLMLWEVDGRAVSQTFASAPIDAMSRIGGVYTPPELRGHGYGSAITAAVSGWARSAGAEYVILFTDLANPTSNSIYQRIGYRPVYDHTELTFDK